jgi:hypothetical protein
MQAVGGNLMQTVNVRVQDKLNVVAYVVHSGDVVAKANRTSVHNDWFVGVKLNGSEIGSGELKVVAIVSRDLPEVVQRKMILAIMKTLPANITYMGGKLQ